MITTNGRWGQDRLASTPSITGSGSESDEQEDGSEERQTAEKGLDEHVQATVGAPDDRGSEAHQPRDDQEGHHRSTLHDHHQRPEGSEDAGQLAEDVQRRGAVPLEPQEAAEDEDEDAEDDRGDVHWEVFSFWFLGEPLLKRRYSRSGLGSRSFSL